MPRLIQNKAFLNHRALVLPLILALGLWATFPKAHAMVLSLAPSCEAELTAKGALLPLGTAVQLTMPNHQNIENLILIGELRDLPRLTYSGDEFESSFGEKLLLFDDQKDRSYLIDKEIIHITENMQNYALPALINPGIQSGPRCTAYSALNAIAQMHLSTRDPLELSDALIEVFSKPLVWAQQLYQNHFIAQRSPREAAQILQKRFQDFQMNPRIISAAHNEYASEFESHLAGSNGQSLAIIIYPSDMLAQEHPVFTRGRGGDFEQPRYQLQIAWHAAVAAGLIIDRRGRKWVVVIDSGVGAVKLVALSKLTALGMRSNFERENIHAILL